MSEADAQAGRVQRGPVVLDLGSWLADGAYRAVLAGTDPQGLLAAGLIALVLAPLATELPEKFNSIIWLRDNKDTLALGNITGAMVFQSTIPVSVGILFIDGDNLDDLLGRGEVPTDAVG